MNRLVRQASLLACLWAVAGCDLSDIEGREAPPAEAAIDELRLYGVTLSPESGRLPELPADGSGPTVRRGGEGGYDHVNLFDLPSFGLYLSPDPERAFTDRPDLEPLDRFPYEYSYGIESGGTFREIPAQDVQGDLRDATVYDGRLKAVSDPEAFLLFGNHVLVGEPVVLPLYATHISLWVRDERDGERRLVRRAPLAGLTGWSRFVEPSKAVEPGR